MRSFLPFATLLGAVFFLGCQGPTASEAQPTALIEASIVPAAISASGIVVSINQPEKHGVIERTDDGSNTLYQFNIPRDLVTGGATPKVGDFVPFVIDPENSRHATFVGVLACPDGTVPPCSE